MDVGPVMPLRSNGPKLTDGALQALRQSLEKQPGRIQSVAFNSAQALIASGGRDSVVRIWSIESGAPYAELRAHSDDVYSVIFNPEGTLLASGGRDSKLRIWDVRQKKQIIELRCDHAIHSLAFDKTGSLIAAGLHNGAVQVWDIQSPNRIFTLYQPNGPITCVCFHDSSDVLASASRDGTISIWNLASKKISFSSNLTGRSINSVVFAADKNILAAGGVDQNIKLWDASNGKLLHTLEGHTGAIDSIIFIHNEDFLATRGQDGFIRIWDTANWKTVNIIPAPKHKKSLQSCMAYDPRYSLLAYTGYERSHNFAIGVASLDTISALSDSSLSNLTYVSAKVAFVGESNAGKSYLAHRIATGVAPPHGVIQSTHGMKFWPLEQVSIKDQQEKEDIGDTAEVYFKHLFLSGSKPTNKDQRRDIVLWDMGGQEEYRLIHQLFLHDTTVALVLVDPTRGHAALKDAESWTKSLDKQLKGNNATKLLVGTKLDKPSEMIDQLSLERLLHDCDFKVFCETSSITGRGIDDLCRAIGEAIDWDSLGKTSRPELFQAIRDEIEVLRKEGIVVILLDDLAKSLYADPSSSISHLIQSESAAGSDFDASVRALDAVCSQLAQQGMIARARTSNGKAALILKIEEVERYAGSLILAAKANQREKGVPALELRTIALDRFHFPQISELDRLPREEERSIVECTVQLMLEHGICFQHEGLIIFPSLFPPAASTIGESLSHTVSLYYDFAGAIDNIYASLIAWLVLAKEFGKVRLWADRAEFEVSDGGLCGLRKVARPGGFAHVDIYFEDATSERKQREFVGFVEDHLSRNGVEIREQIVVPCPRGFVFDEETLRMRIAAGDREVLCPRCMSSHTFAEGATQSRERDSSIAQHTWALRTEIERQRENITKQVVRTLGRSEASALIERPIRLLHLSDLHFNRDTSVSTRLQWLSDDLKLSDGLGFDELDYLVISGDFTDKGSVAGFEKAYDFVSSLTKEFGLSAERCVFIPGNHDICDLTEAYDWKSKPSSNDDSYYIKQGNVFLERSDENYPLRLKPFSDSFYHKFTQKPYPLNYLDQGIAIPFWEVGIQFLTLNSCWQVDQFYRKRSGMFQGAVANAIRKAQEQESDARKKGLLSVNDPILRIGVWHHAVTGPEQMHNTEFLGNLQRNGVLLALHGDVHEMVREQVGYLHKKAIRVIGAGSFGARASDRKESTPCLYNVLEISRNLKNVKVHTRCQLTADSPWDGWYQWNNPGDAEGRVPYYYINM